MQERKKDTGRGYERNEIVRIKLAIIVFVVVVIEESFVKKLTIHPRNGRDTELVSFSTLNSLPSTCCATYKQMPIYM